MLTARIARPIFPVAFANEPDLFTVADTGRGRAYTVRMGDVSQTALVASLPDTASEELRKAIETFGTAFDTVAEQANHQRSLVHPARFPDVMRELIAKYLSGPFQALTKTGISSKRDEDAIWKKWTTPEPGVGSVRQEYRELWRTLSHVERAARVENADIEELAAISEGYGFFSDLQQPVRDMIEQRFVRLNLAKAHAIQGTFAKQPSMNEPLATGVSVAMVEAGAQTFIDNHKERIEHLAMVETTLRSAIAVIAAATELTVEDAWKLLSGRE